MVFIYIYYWDIKWSFSDNVSNPSAKFSLIPVIIL